MPSTKRAEATTTKNELPNVLIQQDGTVSLSFAAIVLGIILATVSGRLFLGFLVGTAGLIFAACQSAMDQLGEEDKQDIRYNIMHADDIFEELKAWEEVIKPRNKRNAVKDDEEMIILLCKSRIHFVSGMEAIAKKYSRRKHQLEVQKQNDPEQKADTNRASTMPSTNSNHYIELLCQQAAYIVYRSSLSNDNQVAAAALSLHALVAKDAHVRQRHLHQTDAYGLDIPAQCIRAALTRAKEETDPDKELQSAELLRKACLLFGALGDGDADVATKIVDEGGLEAVLKTMDWYRYHEDVVNWSTWAVFILSYENPLNKVRTVELGGVPIIVQALMNVPECLEVSRHGIAILFDLLREDKTSPSSQQLDVWRIRKSALAAGLHKAVLQSMNEYSNVIDIMMMGQDILAGTDYRGEVPQYQPNSMGVAF